MPALLRMTLLTISMGVGRTRTAGKACVGGRGLSTSGTGGLGGQMVARGWAY